MVVIIWSSLRQSTALNFSLVSVLTPELHTRKIPSRLKKAGSQTTYFCFCPRYPAGIYFSSRLGFVVMLSSVMEKLNFEEVMVGIGGLLGSFLFSFIVLHRVNLPCTQQEEAKIETTPQTPQTVRYNFPLLKSTFSFLFDGLNFFYFAS